MKLICLGTGTLVPQADRASTGLAVVEDERVLPIDLGRNVLNRMVECGLAPLEMEELLLTHVHPDHCCELVSLLFARNYAVPEAKRRPLRLTGPPGVAVLLEDLSRAWRWLEPRFELRVEEVEGGWTGRRNGFEVEAVAMQHGDTEARGYVVRGSGAVAFTGDTGPGPGLLRLASRCDLLVAECAAAAEPSSDVHLTAEVLAAAVARGGCGRLVVTHLYPGTDREALLETLGRATNAEIRLAEDGMVVMIEPGVA